MGSWAVLGIMLIIFAECGILLGFFLPGDTLLFVSGLFIATGALNINLWLFIALVSLAAFVGNMVGFAIGWKIGPPVFSRPNAKFLKHEYIVKSEAFFAKYGKITIVLARFVPVVRTFAPVLAGVGEMRWRTFAAFNVVGAFIWAVGITLLGYALGSAIGTDNVDKYLYPIIGVIIVLSFIPPFLEWRKHRRARTETEAEAEADELHELLDGE